MEYFESIIDQLTKRASRATLGQFGVRSKPLREFLWQMYSKPPGNEGSFLGDPVFEATFGWKPFTKTMKSLSGDLLEESVVKAMANPPKELKEDYLFDSSWYPYEHQHEAWKHLTADEPRSVIVSSGTGSGKTECFLVPILNDIARRNSRAEGVEALFLYPLNALINSQRDRLAAWTHQLGSNVQFCLYNGETKEQVPAQLQREHTNQQLSRKGLRENPAQILVTNSTMLEYMLVRQKDEPILNKSKGKLRWIVLDEAHTYIGSQAAELSLLLRRVMHGFGVTPQQVRFVATSATIGGKDSDKELRGFLADVAGVDISQVYLVKGEREFTELTQPDELLPMDLSLVQQEEDTLTRYKMLEAMPPLRVLRQHLCSTDNRLSLKEICKLLSPTETPLEPRLALQWMDVCASTQGEDGQAFIPFRLHLFHRVAGGLWACSNPNCSAKKETPLDEIDWRFGMVYMSRRDTCSCGSPVFDMASCNGCGTSLLAANEATNVETGDSRLSLIKPDSSIDDFALDIEPVETDQEEEDEEEEHTSLCLLSESSFDETGQFWLNNEGVLTLAKPERGFAVHRVEGYAKSNGKGLALRCPCCQHTKIQNFEFYRFFRNGAPFMLSTVLPTLLEFCQDGKKEQAKGPWNGRRMITFTDSRQGTARFSAKSQQDSERQFLRSALFHLVIDRTLKSGTLTQEQEADLIKFKKRLAMFEADGDEDMVEIMEEKIAELSQDNDIQISWSDVEQELAKEKELLYWIKESYSRFDDKMVMVQDPLMLARLLLLREFNSRPKRQNTLETLGLIRMEYPNIKDKGNTAPQEWLSLFSSADEGKKKWVDFLTLCINFHVRAMKAISMSEEQQRWVGAKFSAGLLIAPGETSPYNNISGWPLVRKGAVQPRLVRLLAMAFHLDVKDVTSKNKINVILQDAWKVLYKSVLTTSGDGSRLELEKQVSFSLFSNKWQCPHTQKIIDTPLEKVTPYLSTRGKYEDQLCRELETPLYEYPYGRRLDDGTEVPLSEVREWQEQDSIKELRRENAWSDISDRIVERTPYFRVAEHSAQLPAKLLRDYEDKFKKGMINVLSCSTTMEMGVDIGGISVVAMNNAPPNPANYLQRAGRAGRRGESKSVALTLCKSTPHGEHIFEQTRWAFDTPILVPNVSLSSEYIVRRHINALLLSVFLRKSGSENSLRLSCGNFFLRLHENAPSQAELFVDWCKTEALRTIDDGLGSLVYRTILSSIPRHQLVSQAAAQLKNIADNWLSEHKLLVQQSEAVKESNTTMSVAQAAVETQIHKLEGEFLLSEMARKGFLPGYGFPTDVVALNNDNIESINRRKRLIQAIKESKSSANEKLEHRIDNLHSARDYPSRDLSVALRDYAPGSEVVLDGQVYQSSGVLLNWHSPASADQVKEIQSLLWAWRCSHCGASGTSRAMPKECTSCESELDSKHFHRFLEPSSFSIDIRNKPHNDISKLVYVPFDDPWITVDDSDWKEVSNNPSAAFRDSHNGHIYYHSAGLSEAGYALCLECGRMESMPNSDEVSPFEVLAKHRRLRGGKGQINRDAEHTCEGNDKEFSIKGPVRLGHSTHSDVFELVLFNADGSPLKDRKTARSISVLLRNELADKLGIKNDELGCLTKPVNYNEQEAQAIVLYDVASGGAGFSIKASEFLVELLQRAKQKATSCGCDKACHKCLVDYSSQHALEQLNRHKVIEFLNLEFFNRMALPDDFQIFEWQCRRELRPLSTAIEQALSHDESSLLNLHLSVDQLEKLDEWPLLNAMYDWARESHLNVVLDGIENHNFSATEQITLSWLANHPNIQLLSGEVQRDGASLFAEVVSGEISDCWGVLDGYEEQLITGKNTKVDYDHFDVSLETQTGDIGKLLIKDEFNAEAKAFGSLFWTHIFKSSDLLLDKMKSSEVVKVVYSDRYINAPLPFALCFTTIGALLGHYENCRAKIITSRLHDGRFEPVSVQDNWICDRDREALVDSCIDQSNLDIEFVTLDKYQIPHARTLKLTFSDGSAVSIWLDQGFGFWWVDTRDPSNNFPYHYDSEDQAKALLEGRWQIRSGKTATPIFFSLE
ncbi:helicase [Vibrio breoganii]|uniref:DEAD/DEAH box helicase n=1 Tax=Vibrio breoganii TaxID=553239 RepID=UPI000C820E76|nr:DEAD/DEAH box helicase [Vibrio breoganii]PMM86768.1 helicase [Vibrio breoganii]